MIGFGFVFDLFSDSSTDSFTGLVIDLFTNAFYKSFINFVTDPFQHFLFREDSKWPHLHLQTHCTTLIHAYADIL